MALPRGCERCGPDGYWVLPKGSSVFGDRGVERCNCERGRALAALDLIRREPPTLEVEPRITEEMAALGVSMLAVMKFFPTEEGARLVIGDELRSMCADGSQVLWLAKRMCQLFSEWPGLPSLRAVAWSKFIPLDRRPAENEVQLFPDGVPPEIRTEFEYRALPAGSMDSKLDTAIHDLTARKRLN